MAIKYSQCPKCSSNKTVKIVYGFPGSDLFLEAEAGKIKLGGCCIKEGAPEFFCQDCEFEWNYEQAVDNAYNKIKAIKALVGGYFGGSYLVEIDLVSLKVIWVYWEEGKKIATYQKNIRANTAERFIDQLKSVNLLDWKYKYENLDVCDGTGWQVEIFREDRNLVKSGSNAFPKEWDAFCSIIGRLVGKRFS